MLGFYIHNIVVQLDKLSLHLKNVEESAIIEI